MTSLTNLDKIKIALENFHGKKVAHIQEETLWTDTTDILEWHYDNKDKHQHITEIDGEEWGFDFQHPLSKRQDKLLYVEGELCIAFKDGDEVLLLRELFTKYPVWHPDNVFQPGVGIWSQKDKERLMLKTYFEGYYGEKDKVFYRFIFEEDLISTLDIMEEQTAAEEYNKKMLEAGKIRLTADGNYITCPPSEWKDSEEKTKVLAEIEKKKALELLISQGMMRINEEGEYEFVSIKYKPIQIGSKSN